MNFILFANFGNCFIEIFFGKVDFDNAINDVKSKGERNAYALLVWKHKDCGHLFERSYGNFIRTFSCPKCTQQKNQKITHGYCEYIFDQQFKVEERMKDIFPVDENPEIKKLHANVHIDIFQNLGLKDKEGNLIKLGVRYNGKQHDDSPEGWEAMKGIAKHPDAKPGSKIYKELWSQWRKLIETDKIKADVFENNKGEGYYLIIVDYRIPPNQRQQFIIDEFERQTGIKLDRKDSIDWRKLL